MNNNFNFKKSLGQNFLIDENIKNKIVESADITTDSLIIEVGPGNGSITKKLINYNVPVIAFEIDTRLKQELDSIASSNLKVIYKDFLKVNLADELNNYKYSKLHLIANLPYYITTPIVNKVMNETNVDQMIIMVQKEVGERFSAVPNTRNYNSLSVFLQYYFDITKVTLVSKNCFIPKPKVDSIVLKFNRKKNLASVKDINLFFEIVKDSFKQKRKNLKNNLKNYDIDKINRILKNINKDLTFRAEQLTIEDFVYLTNNYID